MAEQHQITPPPELLSKWEDEILKRYENVDVQLLNAYQAGADAELEACCEWLEQSPYGFSVTANDVTEQLRAARRPKPPSLKQQALDALEMEDDSMPLRSIARGERFALIRRALEALPDD